MKKQSILKLVSGVFVIGLAALQGCAPASGSFGQGYAQGCSSGYVHANYSGKVYFSVASGATEAYQRGWQQGYDECLADGFLQRQSFP